MGGVVECRTDGAQLPENNRSGYVGNASIDDIDLADEIFLIGSNPRIEAPVLNARIRKAWSNGANVHLLGPRLDLTYDYAHLGSDRSALETTPGPQNGRFAFEPKHGLTSLMEYESGRTRFNGSVQMADDFKDTIKRIDGAETPLVTPWLEDTKKTAKLSPMKKPKTFKAPKKAVAEDLSRLVGLGEKAKSALNRLGIFYISQLSGWSAGEINWVYSNVSGAVSLNRLKNFVEQARNTKN